MLIPNTRICSIPITRAMIRLQLLGSVASFIYINDNDDDDDSVDSDDNDDDDDDDSVNVHDDMELR